jgi:SAM-dependent methyltransferase
MNREQISRIAHAEHPIKSPLDDDSVRRLLERGLPRGDERVLDLGCGNGEWLLRALATRPHLHAEGVDISEDAVAQAVARRAIAASTSASSSTTRRPKASYLRSRSTW